MMTQLENEHYKEMLETLLNAQRIFKLEVDNQWRKLQMASEPLEQTLQALCQQEPGSRVAAVGSHFNELSARESLAGRSDRTIRRGSTFDNCGALNDPVDNASQKTLVKMHTAAEINAFEQTEFEEQVEEQQLRNLEHLGWRRWVRCVLSPAFDIFIAVAIVTNLVVIMFRIEYEGVQHQPNNYRTSSSVIKALLEVLENMFAAFFVLELILRLLANGLGYLCSFLNMLDIIIVIGACLDVWLLPVVMAGSEPVNLSLLRVFRLIKLTKVLRVIRIVKSFAPLRVLVHAVLSSLGALAWSMFLLFVLQITAAMLLAQTLQGVIRDESKDLQVREKLWVSFGTMVRAWLSMFEMTFAPGAFMKHAYLFDEVNAGFYLLIVTYVCLVTFATIRVITALFLKNTLLAAEKDGREEAARLKSRRLAYAKRLCTHLEEAEGEEPGCGRFDEQGLDRLLSYKRMSDWLLDAGLNTQSARRLFKALDLGDGTANLSDFLDAIAQICDHSKDKELILHHESEKALRILRSVRATLPDKKIGGVSDWRCRTMSETFPAAADVTAAVAVAAPSKGRCPPDMQKRQFV